MQMIGTLGPSSLAPSDASLPGTFPYCSTSAKPLVRLSRWMWAKWHPIYYCAAGIFAFVDPSKNAHKFAATGIVLGNRPNERLGYLRAEQGGWKVGRDDHQRLMHAM